LFGQEVLEGDEPKTMKMGLALPAHQGQHLFPGKDTNQQGGRRGRQGRKEGQREEPETEDGEAGREIKIQAGEADQEVGLS
jgi:hypothetical protein